MEEPLASQDSDLEHLNWIELIEERNAVNVRLREIHEELAVPGRPDDKRYRVWVRGMKADRSRLLTRRDAVKLALSQRQQAAARGAPASSMLPPEPPDLVERRAKLRADLAAGGPDALLVRCRRLIHHLLDGRSPEEAGLSDEDRDTFHDLLVYLRMRYGSTPVREALHGGEG